VSSCLLGDAVRWDGGHKRLACLLNGIGADVRWIRVCPEVELGLGVPREPIELVREDGGVRLRGVESRRDLTGAMTAWARARAGELADLDGYVLKSRSPSCGLRGVPVSGASPGRGLFAAALTERWPDLPLAEETELLEDAGRERFLARARAYREVRQRPRAR
jgi:uncharacterized protein YbbK (DUF523 family)